MLRNKLNVGSKCEITGISKAKKNYVISGITNNSFVERIFFDVEMISVQKLKSAILCGRQICLGK